MGSVEIYTHIHTLYKYNQISWHLIMHPYGWLCKYIIVIILYIIPPMGAPWKPASSVQVVQGSPASTPKQYGPGILACVFLTTKQQTSVHLSFFLVKQTIVAVMSNTKQLSPAPFAKCAVQDCSNDWHQDHSCYQCCADLIDFLNIMPIQIADWLFFIGHCALDFVTSQSSRAESNDKILALGSIEGNVC